MFDGMNIGYFEGLVNRKNAFFHHFIFQHISLLLAFSRYTLYIQTNGDSEMSKEKTAQEAFDLKYEQVMSNLKRLNVAVQKDQDKFNATGSKNWGFVGDLERINDLLIRALGED